MEWINRNYDRVILLVVAIILLIASGIIISRALGYQHNYESIQTAPPRNNKLLEQPTERVKTTIAELKEPTLWNPHPGQLFVSEPYIEDAGTLVSPKKGILHPPIPNEWLIQYKLPITQANVRWQDGDGDGFTNLEEFRAGTDPTNPKNHPPFHTRLYLEEFTQIPFRLIFIARTEDTFQINTLDNQQPSQFLRVGDRIEGTPFQIVAFEEKVGVDRHGTPVDQSELTIVNTVTGDKLILPLNQIINNPDSFGRFVFDYRDAQRIKIELKQEFTLPTEPNVKYRLVQLHANRAVIEKLDTNESIEIPHIKERKARDAAE